MFCAKHNSRTSGANFSKESLKCTEKTALCSEPQKNSIYFMINKNIMNILSKWAISQRANNNMPMIHYISKMFCWVPYLWEIGFKVWDVMWAHLKIYISSLQQIMSKNVCCNLNLSILITPFLLSSTQHFSPRSHFVLFFIICLHPKIIISGAFSLTIFLLIDPIVLQNLDGNFTSNIKVDNSIMYSKLQ